ncbi:hypothetical protein GCM10027051_01860 [Niabella terrae]
MDLKHYIQFQLNGTGNFSDSAARFYKEDRTKIDIATDLIIDHTINAMSFQCYQNNKTEELIKMARDCAGLNLNAFFMSGHEKILAKGKSVISEIFGVKHVNIVDSIASRSLLKNKTVNALTALVTPVALATLNQINHQKDYGADDMCRYLKKEVVAETETLKQLMPPESTPHRRPGYRLLSNAKPFNLLFQLQALFKRAV